MLDPLAVVTVIVPPAKSKASPWLYISFVGAVIAILSTTSESVTFNVALKSCPFVKLFTSVSVYVTVRFCATILVSSYPATMLSVKDTGDWSPPFAYVTVYVILLSLIKSANVSLYSPVTVLGFTFIPVT